MVVSLCAVGILAFSFIRWRWRAHRYLLVGWGWYLISLLPVIGILQVGRQAMADRYGYIPLIGLFVLLVWAASEGLGSRVSQTLLAALSTGIVIAYASITMVQIGYSRNSHKLFFYILEVATENGLAELNFGEALADQDHDGLAEAHFRNAIQYSPDLGVAHYDLATVLQRENRTDEALMQYSLSLPRMCDPMELGQTRNTLGALYLGRKQYAEAMEQFDAAIQINPDEVNSYIGRGMVQFQLGQSDNALASFSRAAELAPSPLAWFWSGRCHEARGEKHFAVRDYQAALRIAPQFTSARSRIAQLQNPPN